VTYQVVASSAAQRDIRRLPPEHKARLGEAMLALAEDPRAQGQKLAVEDAYRKRVGDYRIVFRVNDAEARVLVVRVRHRREVYHR
jgi:mRNA interferase RelE/StbE